MGWMPLLEHMRHTGDFLDLAGFIELVEAGITVCVHPALERLEVIGALRPGFHSTIENSSEWWSPDNKADAPTQ